MQIINPKKRYANAVEEDIHIRVPFEKTDTSLLKTTENKVLSQVRAYDVEKQNSNNYRVYGTVNFISPLDGKKQNITTLNDLFTKSNNPDDRRNFFNMFDIYIVKQTQGTKYEVLTNTYDQIIYNASFSLNLFGEKIRNFHFERNLFLPVEETIFLHIRERNQPLEKGQEITISNIQSTFQLPPFNSTSQGTISIKYTYQNLFEIPIRENGEKIDIPFVNNYFYIYKNIPFFMKVDETSSSFSDVYGDYVISNRLANIKAIQGNVNNSC